MLYAYVICNQLYAIAKGIMLYAMGFLKFAMCNILYTSSFNILYTICCRLICNMLYKTCFMHYDKQYNVGNVLNIMHIYKNLICT